ncbi:unnamed protein product [Rhodiola kirilowii]
MNPKAKTAFALSRLLLRKALIEPSIGAISRSISTLPKQQIHAPALRTENEFSRRWFLNVRSVTNGAFQMGGEEAVSESESEDEDEGEERFTREEARNKLEFFKKKFRWHEEMLKSFVRSGTLDEAYKWMKRIDKFEEKHFRVRPEYRVIGELMSRLQNAEGKEKFMLQQKLNRAVRLAEMRELNDPTNVENLGKLETRPMVDEQSDEEKDKDGDEDHSDQDDEDDIYVGDHALIQKLNAIDKKLEEKLADLAHTFGRKGMVLEDEIRSLAEERNALSEQKSRPVFRKGFDVQLLNVNRTVKVTKGGQVAKFAAIVVCGNYNGVIGYAKAKGPQVGVALRKAHEKCFQNLHTVELYKDHTIPHAVVAEYKKTKIYLWPRPTDRGMAAGRHVHPILKLTGLKNVHSKIIGSRNPFNQVKAVFKALNAMETPNDMQEKLGRSVVESYLL